MNLLVESCIFHLKNVNGQNKVVLLRNILKIFFFFLPKVKFTKNFKIWSNFLWKVKFTYFNIFYRLTEDLFKSQNKKTKTLF